MTEAAALRCASASVGAQWTIVNVAARSFTNFPPASPRGGRAVELDACRELLGRHADREGEEAEPLPARDLVARRTGRRHPERRMRASGAASAARAAAAAGNASPPTRRRPFVHAPTTTSSASSHMPRVSLGSMPKPSSSSRVAERPVPNSSRPSQTQSSIAAISAARTGWL
jgi:hypothetical protein